MQPRHNHDAERSVIGSALRDHTLIPNLPIRAEDFHLPAHEELWRLMSAEACRGRPVDPITLSTRLVEHPVRGIDHTYPHECFAAATTTATAEYYASMVSALAGLRRLDSAGVALREAAATAPWEEAGQALDDARATLDAAANEAAGVKVRTFHDALQGAIDVWSSPKATGYPTGWADLDKVLNGGWHPGQLTVLGARPAVGKSVVAGCAAVAAAGYGAGFFSLEMQEHEVVGRMAAAKKGIRLGNITGHALTDADWRRIADLGTEAVDWPVYIEERSRITMAQIRSHVRTWARRGPVPLVIIDYLQLVTPADRAESRERQVSRVAEDCKHLAKEFETHVLALAQVNRQSTARKDPRPTMADLRESGGIEAFADNIILLHRDDEVEGEIEFIIAKNRHGETGSISLAWRPHYASVNGLSSDPGDARHGIG